MKFYHINKQDELRYFGTFENYLEAYKAHPRWKEMETYGRIKYLKNSKGTNMYSDPEEYFMMVDEDLEIGLLSEEDIHPEFTIVD